MNAEATCHVVAGGDPGAASIDLRPGDLLVAADAGYALCELLGLSPDVVVGDFDSLGAPPDGPGVGEVVRLPCAKDDTDTIAALRIGLARGYRSFEVHAALGGDVGHELANIHCLRFLEERGAHGVLRGGGQRVELVTPERSPRVLGAAPGERVSVFAFGGEARGVSERGLRWELEDAVLRPGDALGVSNEALGADASVGVRSGALLVVVGG